MKSKKIKSLHRKMFPSISLKHFARKTAAISDESSLAPRLAREWLARKAKR